VVIDACRYWARAETWFPSWAELKDQLDARVKRRRRLRDAVMHPQKDATQLPRSAAWAGKP